MLRIILISSFTLILAALVLGLFVFFSAPPDEREWQSPTLGQPETITDGLLPPPAGTPSRSDIFEEDGGIETTIPEFLVGIGGERIRIAPFLSEEELLAQQQALYVDWDEGGDIVWHSYQLTAVGDADALPYEIHYLPPYSFNILLFERPFDEARRSAEAEFIARLDVSEDEACRLDVFVVVPPYIDEPLSGRNLGLSFCPGAEPLWNRAR